MLTEYLLKIKFSLQKGGAFLMNNPISEMCNRELDRFPKAWVQIPR